MDESMKKRIFSILLTLAMVLCLLPAAAFAEGENVAKVGDTEYATLAEAVAAVEDGGTVTLLRSAIGGGIGTYNTPKEGQIKSKSFTIDFAGYTYSVDRPPVGSSGTETQAFHLEYAGKDNEVPAITFKNGTIDVADDHDPNVKVLVMNYCSLTLDNMVLDGRKLENGWGDYTYVTSNCNGNTTIKDTKILSKNPAKDIAFDVDGAKGNYSAASVAIEGASEVYGGIEVSKNNTLAVSGGSFTDLMSAVKYAASGAEIKLLDDVTLTGTVVVKNNVTIDLGGHTLSKNGEAYVIAVAGNGDLTLKNGTVSITGNKENQSAIYIDTTCTAVEGNNNVVIEKDVMVLAPNSYGVVIFGNNDSSKAGLTVRGKVESLNAAISGNGTWSGTEIVVDDGAELISTDSVAIYHPQKGTLTIKGATLTGKGGVEAKSGDSVVTVENATITATGTPSHVPNNSGPSTSGYAVAVVENSNYEGKPTFEIKNGTINGKIAVLKDNEVGESDKGQVTVSGGKFSESVDPELLADGLTAELVYSEGENKLVYTYYPTLEDALAAAEGTEGTVNDLKAAKDKECRVTLVSGLNRASTWLWTQQGSSFTLPQLEKGASQVHVGWKDEAGTYYAVGAKYTVPGQDAVLTAVWQSTDTITPVGPSKPSEPTQPSEPSEPVQPKLPFADVTESDWYYDGVKYVSDKGLMNGTGANAFSPSADTTRGMIVTILARMEGVNTSGGASWYALGSEWAMNAGVSDGTNMEGKITREQLAVMLYRYAKMKGYDVSASADISAYTDASGVSGWAKEAMQWAVGSGLIQGSGSALHPQANASRAEVATILARFAQIVAK